MTFYKNQWIKLLIQALKVNLDLHLQPQKISRTIKYAPEKASIRKTPKNNSELKDSGLKDSGLKDSGLKDSELKNSLLFTPFLSAHNKYPVI